MAICKTYDIPAQDPEVRVKNFDEVSLGYDLELAQAEASRCLNCKNAPCMQGCPVSVHIPDFLSKVKEGDIKGAAHIISMDNNLSSICGRVCASQDQCRKTCTLTRNPKLGGAVNIGAVERFVADYALENPLEVEVKPSIGKRVAVVGSGPAGLSCAADLAKNGVKVTMFEAMHKPGGVLTYGIPEFRLPKDLVQKEINKLLDLGVELETNVIIGKTLFIQELLEEYDAVFIGSGAGLPMFLRIEGENLNGVYSANEFLTRVNLMGAYKDDAKTPVLKGRKVITVGAGNVAMDSCRTALRLAKMDTEFDDEPESHVVYRRSRQEMPARAEEIEHAEQEGVIFDLLTNPVRILGKDGKVCGMECVKMQLGEPDASGRRRPVPIEGSNFIMECDEVIVSLGTSPNPIIKSSLPELEVSKWGTIVADENGQTNIKGLYAGGDAQTGAATVILAMGAGRRAAHDMLAKFQSGEL